MTIHTKAPAYRTSLDDLKDALVAHNTAAAALRDAQYAVEEAKLTLVKWAVENGQLDLLSINLSRAQGRARNG